VPLKPTHSLTHSLPAIQTSIKALNDSVLEWGQHAAISREVVRNRAKISRIWAAKFRAEGASKFLTEFHKSGSPSNVVKFGDDWPSDLGDYAAKKD